MGSWAEPFHRLSRPCEAVHRLWMSILQHAAQPRTPGGGGPRRTPGRGAEGGAAGLREVRNEGPTAPGRQCGHTLWGVSGD